MNIEVLITTLENAQRFIAQDDYENFIQAIDALHLMDNDNSALDLLVNKLQLDQQSATLLVEQLRNLMRAIEQKNLEISSQLSHIRTQQRANLSYTSKKINR